MNGLLARSLAHVHGHTGWLAALALAHPAVLLRRPNRRAIGVAAAATLLVTLAALLGAVLYPHYRATIKPMLFAATPGIGELFERKEHLGVLALVLAWTGLAAHVLAHRRGAVQPQLGRSAFVAYLGAAAVALAAACAGLVVGVHAAP